MAHVHDSDSDDEHGLDEEDRDNFDERDEEEDEKQRMASRKMSKDKVIPPGRMKWSKLKGEIEMKIKLKNEFVKRTVSNSSAGGARSTDKLKSISQIISRAREHKAIHGATSVGRNLFYISINVDVYDWVCM